MKITADQANGGVILGLEGEVDLNTSPQLRAKLKEIILENYERVCVDLSKVKYIDSSGIATLIEAHKNLVNKKRELNLCSIPRKIYSVFEIAKLDMIFKVLPDRSAVLKGWE